MARTAGTAQPKANKALSNDLLHGLTPDEFREEADKLGQMGPMTAATRARLRVQLVERLKTPVDEPSWGPDWIRRGEKVAGHAQKGPEKKSGRKGEEEAETAPSSPRDEEDTAIIARNMEKSRQVAHYKPLYIAAAVLSLVIVLVSMFVDYHIIREVWTRALANEFMVVPPELQASVMFKSLQVVFAVLIVHFMLKITGVYGRATMITASFIMAMLMISGLGYIVAYNNMDGGTATAKEQTATVAQPQNNNAIEQLFASEDRSGVQQASLTAATSVQSGNDGVSIGLPKLSATSLAHADTWFWLAFASVVFFIVTTVAALYMQTVENNVRNLHIAKDYTQRRRDFALLHLLDLSENRG